MNAIVEVAIGLGFVYLLFSALASSLTESVSALLDRRSKSLWRTLGLILGPDLRRKLLNHPAIAGIELDRDSDDIDAARGTMRLWWPARTPPNYLSPRSVALALADIGPTTDRMATLIRTFQSDGSGAINAEGLFRLEKWFTEQMERTSNEYKRWTQVLTLVVVVVLTGIFDLDTIRIASGLYQHSALRTAVADKVADELKGKTLEDISKTSPSLTVIAELPIGWTAGDGQKRTWIAAVLGWLLTVLALSLGAPFWFDAVGKFVNLRLAGKKPQADPQQFAG
jgi:hypothetical protein